MNQSENFLKREGEGERLVGSLHEQRTRNRTASVLTADKRERLGPYSFIKARFLPEQKEVNQ